MTAITVDVVLPEQSQAVYDLRLRALQEDPKIFGQSIDEYIAQGVEPLRTSYQRQRDTNMGAIFGAWDGDALVGMAGCARQHYRKESHKTYLWGVYVLPAARGQALGRRMVEDAIQYSRSLVGVEDVTLAVTEGNNHAYQLYLSVGFEHLITEPRYYKIEGVYHGLIRMVKRL